MRTMLYGLAAGVALWAAGNAGANYPPANCSNCDNAHGKVSLFERLKNNNCSTNCAAHYGYGSGQCGNGCNNGFNPLGSFCAWWKRPCGLDAPTRKTDYPLAFPSHPYIRSPRDYFMVD